MAALRVRPRPGSSFEDMTDATTSPGPHGGAEGSSSRVGGREGSRASVRSPLSSRRPSTNLLSFIVVLMPRKLVSKRRSDLQPRRRPFARRRRRYVASSPPQSPQSPHSHTRPQAKRDQLKKEGKLLTPKQKAEKAAAEIRLNALRNTAGVTIAGLQENTTGEAPKKVSYAKKKPFKKGPAVVEAEPEVEVVPVVEEVKATAVVEEDEDVKDDWDVSDEEEKVVAKVEDVKDDWDASESEEEKVVVAAPVAVKAVPVPAKGESLSI